MLPCADAVAIVKHQIATIKIDETSICAEASLFQTCAKLMKSNMFLNEYALYDALEELKEQD